MARRRNKHAEEHAEGEQWLLPYSDLMTLLLAVFIVLFAVSNLDANKMKAMSSAFQSIITGGAGILEGDSGTGINPNVIPSEFVSNTSIPSKSPEELMTKDDLENLGDIKSKLDTYFEHENLDTDISSRIDERGLVISMSNSILFDSGSADVKPENIAVLVQIGGVLDNIENYIRIEGHTDNVPINSAVYPSNWELSGARAARVVRLLVQESQIDPDKLVAVGYGEYKPVADNTTHEGRAENRRVDIIVLNTKYDSLEAQINDVPEIR